MRVERTVVQMGVTTDGNTGSLAGHPGTFERLNVGLVPVYGSANWSAGVNAFPAGSEATLEIVQRRFNVPRRFRSDGPVTAIAIAPDSPIEAADLYVGAPGAGALHRLAPGCPYLGRIDDNIEVSVAPIRDLPPLFRREFMLGTISGDAQNRETKYWDQDTVINAAGAFGGPYLYPLRLDVYRGAPETDRLVPVPSMLGKRAQYTANMMFEVIDRGGAVPTSPALNVVIDGRRRVRVVSGLWVGGGAAGNLHVYGIEGRPGYLGDKTTTAPSAFPLDWPVYDEILAPTAIPVVPSCLVFDYGGGGANPYFGIQCAVEAGVIGTRGFITVHAWDD